MGYRSRPPHAPELYHGLPFFPGYGQTQFYRRRFARAADHLLCVAAYDRLLSYYALLLVELLAGLLVAGSVLLLGVGRARGWRFAAGEPAPLAVALDAVLRVPARFPSLFYALAEAVRGMGAVQRIARGEDEPSWDARAAPSGWPSAGRVEALTLCATPATPPTRVARSELCDCSGRENWGYRQDWFGQIRASTRTDTCPRIQTRLRRAH